MTGISKYSRAWTLAICSLLVVSNQVFGQGAAPKLETPSAAAVRIFKAAAKQQNAGKFKFGAELWEDFLKKNPNTIETPRAQHYAGVCHLQLKDYTKAAPHFVAVTTKWSKNVTPVMLQDAYLNLGSCYFELAKLDKDTPKESYDKSGKVFDELLTKFPATKYKDQALYFHAESMYWKGDKAEAVKSYAKLVADEKLKASALRDDAVYLLGTTYQELNQYEDASKTYDIYIKDHADQPFIVEVQMRKGDMVLIAGRAAAKDGNANEAKALFEDALKRLTEVDKVENFNKKPYTLLKMGECYSALQDFENAAKTNARLAEGHPTSSHIGAARLNAARNFFNAKDSDEALKWCKLVIDNDATNAPEAAHWAAKTHLRNGDHDKAVEQASAILPRAGESKFLVDLKMDKADGLYGIADRQIEALLLYEAIAKDHADNSRAPEALYFAAFTAMELDKIDQANAAVETFTTKHADHYFAPDIGYISAKCKLQGGMPAEAETEFKALISKYPTHDSAELWHILLGESLYKQKKYDDVITALGTFVGNSKTQSIVAEGQHFIGLSQFELGKFDMAATAFDASLSADARWANADLTSIYWSRSLYKLSKNDEAIAKIKETISGYAESKRLDEANYRLGEFSYAKKDYPGATAAYAKVIDSWPDSVFASYAKFWKGWAQTEDKKYDGAVASFTAFLDDHADHELASDARYARGACQRLNGNYEEAVKDLDAFLATNPDNKDKCSALFEKGRAEVKLESYKAAAKSFQDVIATDPKYAKMDEVTYELAWAYKLDGESEEALKSFRKIIKDFPDSKFAADSHFRDGEELYKDTKFEESKAAYIKAKATVEAGSLKEAITYKLGWSNYQLKEYDAALKEFTEQTKDYPDGSLYRSGLFMFAESNFKLKNRDEALPAYTKLLGDKASFAKLPETSQVLVHLHGGQCAVETKKWQDGLTYLSVIPSDFPDSNLIHEAHFEIGRCHEGLKDDAKALKSYEKATNGADGLAARAYYMIGEVHFKRKEFSQAVKQFQLTLSIDETDNAEVKKWHGYACYEVARCADVRIMDAEGAVRAQFIADAKKYYNELVTKYSGAPAQLIATAKKRVTALGKLK